MKRFIQWLYRYFTAKCLRCGSKHIRSYYVEYMRVHECNDCGWCRIFFPGEW